MARDIAKTDAYVLSSCARKKVEMLFAHLKRIIGLHRLRLRGPDGAKDEFHLVAMAQNLRKLARLVPNLGRRTRTRRLRDRSEPVLSPTLSTASGLCRRSGEVPLGLE